MPLSPVACVRGDKGLVQSLVETGDGLSLVAFLDGGRFNLHLALDKAGDLAEDGRHARSECLDALGDGRPAMLLEPGWDLAKLKINNFLYAGFFGIYW